MTAQTTLAMEQVKKSGSHFHPDHKKHNLTPRPFSFKQIVFCKYSIVSQEPNKNFNLFGNFALPNILMKRARIIREVKAL